MLNHINPYEFQDKITEIRKEIELRKERGEVPKKIIPDTNWSSLKFWRWRKENHSLLISEPI